jgi:hypothetical protein
MARAKSPATRTTMHRERPPFIFTLNMRLPLPTSTI